MIQRNIPTRIYKTLNKLTKNPSKMPLQTQLIPLLQHINIHSIFMRGQVSSKKINQNTHIVTNPLCLSYQLHLYITFSVYVWVGKKASAGSKQYFFHNSSFTLDFSVNQVVYGEALIIFSFRFTDYKSCGFSVNLSSCLYSDHKTV